MRNGPQSSKNPYRSLLRKDGGKGNEVRSVGYRKGSRKKEEHVGRA